MKNENCNGNCIKSLVIIQFNFYLKYVFTIQECMPLCTYLMFGAGRVGWLYKSFTNRAVRNQISICTQKYKVNRVSYRNTWWTLLHTLQYAMRLGAMTSLFFNLSLIVFITFFGATSSLSIASMHKKKMMQFNQKISYGFEYTTLVQTNVSMFTDYIYTLIYPPHLAFLYGTLT